MAVELKTYFDAARAASDEVQRIMANMTEALALGTEEGEQQALEMRPTLDAARAKAEQANALYVSMRDAAQVVAAAPVGNLAAAAERNSTGKTRAEFEAMTPAERMKYALAGGEVTEE